MREFIIDTDTASDDAVAIIMALAAPDVRVLALTTVAGNVSLEQGTKNALLTAEICGSDVPVFKGAAAPLLGSDSTHRPVVTVQRAEPWQVRWRGATHRRCRGQRHRAGESFRPTLELDYINRLLQQF